MADNVPPRTEKDSRLSSHVSAPAPDRDVVAPPTGVVVREDGIELKHNRFDVSVLTMVLTSLVTAFIPLLNGLLGGTAGGYHAGTYRRAFGAAAVTSVVVPATLFLLFNVFGMGSYRFYYGLGWSGFTVLHIIGTFIGAAAGAASRPLFAEDFSYVELARVSGPRFRERDVVRSDRPPAETTRQTVSGTEVTAAPPSAPAREE